MSQNTVYLSLDCDSLETPHKNSMKIYFWVPHWERLGEGLARWTEYKCVFTAKGSLCRLVQVPQDILAQHLKWLSLLSGTSAIFYSQCNGDAENSVQSMEKLSVYATTEASILQLECNTNWLLGCSLIFFQKILKELKPHRTAILV